MDKKPLKVLFDAMYHGKYEFNDFICGEISENYTFEQIKKRLICKPNKILKLYHSFLNLFLLEYLKVNENVVYSYRKGVNVYDAVSKHAKSKHFFQTDLIDFFKSLNSDLIKSTILASSDLLPISDIDINIDRIVNLVTVENSLPMGFATSPLISNACLFEFDNKLLAYCVEKGLIYTRYSDDIIISSDEKANLIDVKEAINSMLKECFGNQLKINSSKSKFSQVGNKIKLLGIVILPNKKVTVDMKFKKNIEVLLHFYVKDRQKFLDKVNGDSVGGMEKISGHLNYINTVDVTYLDKLRKKYGATIVDMFLHKSEK